jgi:hypothetical protein
MGKHRNRSRRHGPYLRGFLCAWDEWHVEAEHYGELDRGRVLVP